MFKIKWRNGVRWWGLCIPGDDSEGSRNGEYAEERPEGETGLGKTQVDLVRKKLKTYQMEIKQAGVAKIR